MRAIVIAVGLVLLFCGIFYSSTAYAVCPEGYIESVEQNELDWYMDDLDIDWVADKVESMLQDSATYDFSELKPIVIAVIDTGINFNHEIFEGKYDENGKPIDTQDIGEYDVFLRDAEGNVISKNVVNPSKSCDDDAKDYHGTHVAGIVATFIHKLNLEKYIKILPIKASSLNGKDSKFAVSDLKNAIDFALEKGADVINMSLADSGVGPNAKSDYDFVTKEMANSAIFVASAGNGKKNFLGTITPQSSNNVVCYPAGSENVIGVMNYTLDDGERTLSAKSNYGSKYDICLPGANIYSADGSTNDEYKELSGTSMATPIASFACALKTLQNRAMCKKNNFQPKTPQEIASFVMNSYTDTISKDKFELKVFDFKKLFYQKNNLQVYADKDIVYISDSESDSVTLTALLEEQADLSQVSWIVKNEQGEEVSVGSGNTFEFEPKTFGGSYEITATIEIGGDTLCATTSITVVYMQDSCIDDDIEITIDISFADTLDEVTINDDGSVIISSGQSLLFAINTFEGSALSPMTDILWYVNGEYVASGEEFSSLFQTVGEYNVQAKINGVFTPQTKVVVEPSDVMDTQSSALIICCSILCVAIVLAFVLTLVVAYIKKGSR